MDINKCEVLKNVFVLEKAREHPGFDHSNQLL